MTDRRGGGFGKFLKSNMLTILTIVGVIGGTIGGLILKHVNNDWSKRDIMYIQYPGELFLRCVGRNLLNPTN